MDFQKIVDGFAAMTCVVSVEKRPDGGHGEIRIVTGNPSYIASIEQPIGDVVMLKTKFVPNSLYTEYMTQDLNFEDSCYRAAVEKKCLHAYAHPDRFDVWFNMTFLPLAEENGNLCYCTYTMEINLKADSSRLSQISGDLSSSVLETLIDLRGAADFQAAMSSVIKKLRKICFAERCCILLLDPEQQTCSVLCEDRAPDSSLSHVSDIVNDSFYALAATWEETISGSNCLIVKTMQEMEVVRERNPVWYEGLMKSGVSSIILFPLKFRNRLLGYIWASNFDTEKAPQIKEALELTAFILGSEISNYLLMDRLRVLSSRDMLTGVLNRNEMNNDMDRLAHASGKPVGIIFADLNGLKTVNDSEGHDAGDQLLRDAVSALREVFHDEEIYRVGGDEFTMILLNATEEDLARKAEQLRLAEKKYGKVSFAIGWHAVQNAVNIREALRIADERMYEDKRGYYRDHPSARRARPS